MRYPGPSGGRPNSSSHQSREPKAALLQGILNALIQGQRYNAPFVERQTTGIEGLKTGLVHRTLEAVID